MSNFTVSAIDSISEIAMLVVSGVKQKASRVTRFPFSLSNTGHIQTKDIIGSSFSATWI